MLAKLPARGCVDMNTTTGQKIHQEVKNSSLKEKKEKLNAVIFAWTFVKKKETKKQKENKLYIPLIICFFYCCCAAAVTKSKQKNKNNKCCVCVCRKEDMNSETSN